MRGAAARALAGAAALGRYVGGGLRPLRKRIEAALEQRFPGWRLRRGHLDEQLLGRLGEALARRYLARRGLVPLARRVLIGGVEIDLLLRSPTRLVLVEVKCSQVQPDLGLAELRWPPGWRLDRPRWIRLRQAAGRARRPGQPRARIDLVEVLIRGPQRRVEIRWWPDLAGPLNRADLAAEPGRRGSTARPPGAPRPSSSGPARPHFIPGQRQAES
mgnify:FL=1